MTVWLLIIATHQGGRIDMAPVGRHATLTACTDAGRTLQRESAAQGKQAASLCQEVRK